MLQSFYFAFFLLVKSVTSASSLSLHGGTEKVPQNYQKFVEETLFSPFSPPPHQPRYEFSFFSSENEKESEK
jgi:hypothetical protein